MSELDSLSIRVRNRRRELDALSGEARSVLTRGKELQAEIAGLATAANELEKVTILFNSLGEEKQIKAQETIEGIVTKGLQMIFDDTLSFHILQSTKAKAANVDFIIRTTLPGSTVDTGVLDARGGGVAATVGFLLRLVVLMLQTGTKQESILVLDETFAHVSAEYLEPLNQFIREIVDKSGIQILMVTHQPELAEYADAVYRFGTDSKGMTKVHKDS